MVSLKFEQKILPSPLTLDPWPLPLTRDPRFSNTVQLTGIEEFPKYSDRLTLDNYLLVLQCVFYKMIKVLKWDPKEGIWQPLIIIEQIHHAKLIPYLQVKRYFDDSPLMSSIMLVWTRVEFLFSHELGDPLVSFW